MADDYTRQGSTFRAYDRGSKIYPAVAVMEVREDVPVLSGATLVYTVDDSPAVPLDPPDAGAHTCWIRVWHTTQSATVRLFYRCDGTAPTANGANAEGYLLHGEGRLVKLATLTNFQMISETGGAHTVFAEFRNL